MARAVSVGTTTAILLAGCGLFAGQQPAQEPTWHTDYAQARDEARRTGKPIFALFH